MLIDRGAAIVAPKFHAVDSQGHDIRLSDFKDKNNVMLVFNRGFS